MVNGAFKICYVKEDVSITSRSPSLVWPITFYISEKKAKTEPCVFFIAPPHPSWVGIDAVVDVV